MFFFLNDTATTEIYPLPLHDALPIYLEGAPDDRSRPRPRPRDPRAAAGRPDRPPGRGPPAPAGPRGRRRRRVRSEEHTSELQSRQYLVCRLLLEKKKITVVIRPHMNA